MMLVVMTAGAHEIIKFHLASMSTSLYPGTERDVEVYVPDAYDGRQLRASMWVSTASCATLLM